MIGVWKCNFCTEFVVLDHIIILAANYAFSMLMLSMKTEHSFLPFYLLLVLFLQTFQESLIAAGAGIALVDSVVMYLSRMLVSLYKSFFVRYLEIMSFFTTWNSSFLFLNAENSYFYVHQIDFWTRLYRCLHCGCKKTQFLSEMCPDVQRFSNWIVPFDFLMTVRYQTSFMEYISLKQFSYIRFLHQRAV